MNHTDLSIDSARRLSATVTANWPEKGGKDGRK